ncbi:hypothetical protein PVAP13_6NG161503 [Panicum virgatum]|uniref:Uncharacterized protein n=1 Tax=Panicum virgatum TaxID=38727 RepID=A0A8T0QY31_PANVG|nr:hypothetical protein PVAP13_6NG161503 [Panicum virgatum]
MVHCEGILFCDACFRYLIVFVMASSPSYLPIPVAITKNYAECHFWFLELTEAMAQKRSDIPDIDKKKSVLNFSTRYLKIIST